MVFKIGDIVRFKRHGFLTHGVLVLRQCYRIRAIDSGHMVYILLDGSPHYYDAGRFELANDITELERIIYGLN